MRADDHFFSGRQIGQVMGFVTGADEESFCVLRACDIVEASRLLVKCHLADRYVQLSIGECEPALAWRSERDGVVRVYRASAV